MIELNKIYNEDNLKTMERMPNEFIDLTVTSPPYDNLRTYKGYSFDFESIAKELFRVTKKGGVVVWVVGDATINGSETGTSFRQALYFMECGFNLHDTMIWVKDQIFHDSINTKRYRPGFEYMFIFSNRKPNKWNPIKDKPTVTIGKTIYNDGGRKPDGSIRNIFKKEIEIQPFTLRNNVWVIKPDIKSEQYFHPATFTEQIAIDHIKSWSNESDLIYDPFMGSGTTLKMAHLLKRNWIGSEISKEYCELANKRIQPYLDQKTLF